jgi:hypothetical protein
MAGSTTCLLSRWAVFEWFGRLEGFGTMSDSFKQFQTVSSSFAFKIGVEPAVLNCLKLFEVALDGLKLFEAA